MFLGYSLVVWNNLGSKHTLLLISNSQPQLEHLLTLTIGDYDDGFGEIQPYRPIEMNEDLRPRTPMFDYDSDQFCTCDLMIEEFRKQMGPLGNDLIDAIQGMDITNNKHTITMHGKLLHHLCSYFTYKQDMMGNESDNNAFKVHNLKDKFRNTKFHDTKIQRYVSLSKF